MVRALWLWLLVPATGVAQTLEIRGACPGTVTLTASGLTPGGTYAVLSSPGTGTAAMAGGPCAGTTTGLATPSVRRRGVVPADGVVTASPSLGAAACGVAVQWLDGSTCAVTNAVPLTDGMRGVDLDDPALRWLGRVDDTDPTARPLYWPGSGFVTDVEGDAVHIEVEDTTGNNHLVITADGVVNRIVDLVPGHQWVEVDGLGAGLHTLRLTKRTEGADGDAIVRRILIESGAAIQASPSPAVRFEFYGDSITAGYSVLCVCDDGSPQYKAHDLTYASLTAAAFDGEHTAVAISGVGIERSWWPANMFDYWDSVRDSDHAWDFAEWPADVVVINLGQNDYWLGVGSNLTDAYVDFGLAVRAVHPTAEVFFALGSMDAVAPGSPVPGYLQDAVTELNTVHGDPAVHAVVFDYNGVGIHPVVPHQQDMADTLIDAITAARPDLVP